MEYKIETSLQRELPTCSGKQGIQGPNLYWSGDINSAMQPEHFSLKAIEYVIENMSRQSVLQSLMQWEVSGR